MTLLRDKAGQQIARPVAALLFFVCCAVPLLAATPEAATIVAVRQGRFSNSDLVRIRGTITAFSGWKNSFFLQDANDAISVDRTENTTVQPGDQVEVTGHVRPGLFAPIVVSDAVSVLGRRSLPAPQQATYEELSKAHFDSKQVEVSGVVQSAEVSTVWGRRILLLRLHVPGGVMTVHVLDFAGGDFSRLVDSTVRVTGVCGTIFNERKQLVGVRLFVNHLDQVQIAKQALPVSEIPISPLDGLLRFDGPSLDHRIRVSGTITYRAGTHDLYLQQGDAAIRVQSDTALHLPVGSQVNASGFVFSSDSVPVLRDAEIADLKLPPQTVHAVPIRALDTIRTEAGFTQAPYNGRLVELRAYLVELVPTGGSPLLLLRDGTTQFQAQWPADLSNRASALEPGTEVTVTGICLVDVADGEGSRSFRVLLRSPQDVRALNAPYWSSSILLLLAILVLILLGSLGLWFYHRSKNRLGAGEFDVFIPVQWRAKCSLGARVLAFLSVCLGAAVVIGWRFDIPFLHLGDAHGLVMPNGAAGFLAAGISVLCIGSQRRWACITGAASVLFCMAIGFLTLLEYGASLDLHIDQLLVCNLHSLPDAIVPGRMAIATALCMLLTGLASLSSHRTRFVGLGQVLALASAIISLLNLAAIVFGSQSRHGAGAYATMSLPAAAAILSLNLAVLFSRVHCGFMQSFLSYGGGGLMARRMLPVAVVGPFLLAWIRLQGQIAGWYDTRFGLALFTCSTVVCAGFLIWSCADFLNGLEAKRSRAESSLRERDRRLEQVFKDAAVGDFCWDAVADSLTAHPVIWNLYGAPKHAGTESRAWFSARQHPDDVPRIEAEMRAAIDGNRVLDIEFRVLQPDRSVRWICCRAQLECDAAGKLLQVAGINFDITDRKLAELAVVEREERFRQLADAMPQIVWTARADGTFDYCNQGWYRYTGLSCEHSWRLAIHEEDLVPWQEKLAQSIASGSPCEGEIRIQRSADGAYRWHLTRRIPICDDGGTVLRWFGTATDIHDYKHATTELERLNRELEGHVRERSAALLKSEQRRRSMIESITDYSIFMVDRNGRVNSWNAGAERIKQYTAAEILGRHFSVFYPASDMAVRNPERQLQIAAAEGRYGEEGWCVRKDGSLFWANILITHIRDKKETISGFSIVVRDLTEQKKAEETIREEQRRAQEANQAKSEFLAAMSHEIRTPMNAILGMADLLWETELEATQRRYVEIFRRAGANLLALVNDILDLSKIESGHFELEHVAFDLDELIARTVELIRPKAEAKGLAISASLSRAIPAALVGDPNRLQQVLMNLLGNAVKFTDQGKVSLTVEAASQFPGHLSFKIADTGIGIPEDKLGKIFEDFTQAESSISRRFGGTGLGLGISRRLVARLGGDLTVTSQYGQGSCFQFDATFAIGSERSRSDAEATLDLAGRHILIFDQNATTRMIFAEMCDGWGMKTTVCADAPTTLRSFKDAAHTEAPFEAVMVDRQAPGGGFDLAEQIRSQKSETAVVITTADEVPGEATRAEQLRLAGYILKPVRRYDLLRLLCRAFAKPGSDFQQAHPSGGSGTKAARSIKHRILIAEDSEDNRFLVQAYLKDGPYDLTFAENGEVAVQLFCTGTYDLVLMDMQMPLVDGLTATSRIRAYEQAQAKRPLPIVALTANARESDVAACKDAGCTSHLSKPIAKAKLLRALDGYLEASQQSDVREQEALVAIPEGMEEAAKRYLISRKKDVATMQDLLGACDFTAIRKLAHNMKGTGTPYGFPSITELGGEIEARSKEPDADAVSAQLARLAAYVNKAAELVLG